MKRPREAHECAEGDWAKTTDYTCQRIGARPTPEEYAKRLHAFYLRHAPEKAQGGTLRVEELLRKWDGREERMFHVLRQKYGVKDEL